MDLNYTSVIGDARGIYSEVFSSLSQQMQNKLELLINISKVLVVVMIVYFIILIIAKIYQIRDSRNLSRISENTSEINDKLTILAARKGRKK